MKERVNKELILRKIDDIEEELKKIKNIKDITIDEFLSDEDRVDALKFRLLKIIEASIGICSHVVVKLFGIIPESYSECFKILGDKKIIDKELSNKLVKMAKFRNLLIHMYYKVDDREVYKIIKENLSDIEMFVKEIEEKFL